MVSVRHLAYLILLCWSVENLSGATGLPMPKKVIRRKRQSSMGFRDGFSNPTPNEIDDNSNAQVGVDPQLTAANQKRPNNFGPIYVTPYYWVTSTGTNEEVLPIRTSINTSPKSSSTVESSVTTTTTMFVGPTTSPTVTTVSSTVPSSKQTETTLKTTDKPSKIIETTKKQTDTTTPTRSVVTTTSPSPLLTTLKSSKTKSAVVGPSNDPCGTDDSAPPNSQSFEFFKQRRKDIGRYPHAKPNCRGKNKTISIEEGPEGPISTSALRSNLGSTRPPAFALAPPPGDEDKFTWESSLHAERTNSADFFRATEWRLKKSRPKVVVLVNPTTTTSTRSSTMSTTTIRVTVAPAKIANNRDEPNPSEWAINTGRASIG